MTINNEDHTTMNSAGPWYSRVLLCGKQAFHPSLKTAYWILSISVPVSFGVFILQYTGTLHVIARFFTPLFLHLGLPGESAIVFATACFLNVYSSIVVIQTLGFAGRTVTILALMCLVCHNLPVESVVQKKTGAPAWKMVVIRLAGAVAGGFVLNRLLPAEAGSVVQAAAEQAGAAASFLMQLQAWFFSTMLFCVKIILFITMLMILQRVMEEFGITTFLSRLLKYPLMVLGVPHEAAFLWIVANTIGLAYGAGVLIDYTERGKISKNHALLLNYHIAVSHSLFEDTLLFVAIGVSAGWIIFPRLALAAVVVWAKRLIDWTVARVSMAKQ